MADVWYGEGLSFECTGCGGCCRGAPGYVWVKGPEIEALARHLGMNLDRFGGSFLRKVRNRFSLLERPNGDCIFYREGKGCSVYAVRPVQCRTFPFWPENICDPEAWDVVKEDCPGAGRGRLFSADAIRRARDGKVDGETRP